MSGVRRSQVADFLRSFNDSYNLTSKVAQDFDIAKIANAQPVTSQGFTDQQGKELASAAAAGADIAYDDQGKAYVVTPNLADNEMGPPQSQRVAMQGVTDFLGTRSAGAMTDGHVNNARQRAMAGVLMKSDPVSGSRMLREVNNAERQDEEYARAKKEQDAVRAALAPDPAVGAVQDFDGYLKRVAPES